MTIDEIIEQLEAVDPKNGGDRQVMLDLDADIALLIARPWRGATVEKARLCDADAASRNMDSIGAGWIGWCLLTKEGDAIHFRRVPPYTSRLDVAMTLWKWPPPELVPSHPIACCVAALKAKRGDGEQQNDGR